MHTLTCHQCLIWYLDLTSNPTRQWLPLPNVCGRRSPSLARAGSRGLHSAKFDINVADDSVVVTSPPACGCTDSSTSPLSHLVLGFDICPGPFVSGRRCQVCAGDCTTRDLTSLQPMVVSSSRLLQPVGARTLTRHYCLIWHLGLIPSPSHMWLLLPIVCGRCSPALGRVGSGGLQSARPDITLTTVVLSSRPLRPAVEWTLAHHHHLIWYLGLTYTPSAGGRCQLFVGGAAPPSLEWGARDCMERHPTSLWLTVVSSPRLL